jgi:hypothetical protein
MTKSDLVEFVDDPVTEDDVSAKKEECGFQGYALTSSKEWEDFNVHKMFQQAIAVGYFAKYEQKL